MKIKEFFNNIDCLQSLVITLAVMVFLQILMLSRLLEFYLTQANIVIHDYGQVFESEEEWIKWRLDNEK